MVKIRALLLLPALLSSLLLAEPVQWLSYETALAEAPRVKKLIYVYFYSETCPACHIMKRVFEDLRVSERLNRDFLPVRVNVAEHPDLVIAFRVPGTPAHLFICPNGTPLGGALGYRDAEGFLELTGLAQKEAEQRCPDLETREERGPGDQQPLEVNVALLLSLLIGLITPFSPCILPLLPVMYLAASSGGRKGVALFAFGLFSFNALLGAVASGFFLTLRTFAEPLAYCLLFFSGLALLTDQVGKKLSHLASRVATRLSGGAKQANPFLLGVLTTVMWGPCAAPMAVAAFSLAAFSRGLVETVATSIAFAAGLAFTVYALTLGLRKVRFIARRASAVKKLNRVLGLLMVLASLLHFIGLITS